MDKLISGGVLVLPDGQWLGDLLIRGETIAAIGAGLTYDPANTEIISAAGAFVFPGFIDAHTYFQQERSRLVSPDDYAYGSKAALLGGTTTVLDVAGQSREGTLQQSLAQRQALAQGQTSCDYGFHLAVNRWHESIAREMAEVADEGVTSFTVDMADEQGRLSDWEIFAFLEQVGEIQGLLGCHCENGDLIRCLTHRLQRQNKTSVHFHPAARPAEVEAEAVQRYLTIGDLAGQPVQIPHLSTARGIAMVLEARARGQEVYVETCPQYLMLNQSRYLLPEFAGAAYVAGPPLRSAADQEALWRAVASGAIDTIGTEHCAFNIKGQKDLGRQDFALIPAGLPGVQHRIQLLFTYGVNAGRMTLSDLVRLCGENPAKLFGLYPRKGVLAVNSDADIVIWDPDKESIIKAAQQSHNVDNTPYEGFVVKGMVRQVFLRGKLVVAEGELVSAGGGIYLSRGPAWRFRKKIY